MTLTITSFLPHESAKAADPSYSGLSYKEANVGDIGGGTIFSVWQEAMVFHRYLSGAKITLDTPDPVDNFTPRRRFPFETLSYPLPRQSDGAPMQWWEMREAYHQDKQWMSEHLQQRLRPGKHIVFAHHNVGAGLETDLARLTGPKYKQNRLLIMRYHSQLLIVTKTRSPEYFAKTYGSYDPRSPTYRKTTDYLHAMQREAMHTGDLHVFATDGERDASIAAVTAEGCIPQEEAQEKFVTIAPFINSGRFSRDNSKGTLRQEQLKYFNLLLPSVQRLPQERRYIGYVGRLDWEKNVWALIEAYGHYRRHYPDCAAPLPDLLIIGGPTNKPGVGKRHAEMLQFVSDLPPQISGHIHIAGFPYPHEQVVHLFDMEIYPSLEESFNISEKQARAAGKLVALSDLAIGHVGTNTTETALFFTPTDDWHSFIGIFEAAQHIYQYRSIIDKGYSQAHQRFSNAAIFRKTMEVLNEKFPGFIPLAST